MGRRLAFLSVGLALLAASGGAASEASNPTRGADIYGVGGGKTDVGTFDFDLSAHSEPNGDFGRVGVRESTPVYELQYSVAVDCVNINPVTSEELGGTISGVVTKVSPVPNVPGITVGHRFFFFVQDGGEPSPRLLVDSFIPKIDPAPPANCKTISLGGAQKNVTQGNIVVKSG